MDKDEEEEVDEREDEDCRGKRERIWRKRLNMIESDLGGRFVERRCGSGEGAGVGGGVGVGGGGE